MKSLKELLLGQSKPPQYTIYCDMDGVLTDFEKRFLECLKTEGKKYYSLKLINSVQSPKDFEEKEGTKEFWKFIDEHIGETFWSEMDWMKGGGELWDFIVPYKPVILTSPSRHSGSKLGKKLWVQQNLTPVPEVRFKYGKAKSDYANEKAILIDDRDENLKAFKAKSGLTIKCEKGNITPVINKLKELGYGR